MRILIFGGAGQLGAEINKRARDLNFEIFSPVVSELDISESDQVEFLTKKLSPDLVINAAAFTAVDLAEENETEAYRINDDGARNVAVAVRKVGARLIHISTDYVFPGNGEIPLKEEDPVGPLSVYGKSKLAGERAIQDVLSDEWTIVRTSSLHGAHGGNFVHTMIKLFKEKDELKVVNDQFMCATWAGWLAEVVLDLGRAGSSGVFHASSRGVISWFDFANGILQMTADKLGRSCLPVILPVSASEFPRPAARPKFSAFDCTKLEEKLGRACITWEEGLENHLGELRIEEIS